MLPLVTWRGRRGWTQPQLAAAAGLHRGTISEMETQPWRLHLPWAAQAVAAALDVPLGQIAEFQSGQFYGHAQQRRGTA